MMKMIGGRWKNLRLNLPDDSRTRPTSARTKEGIFNVLEHRLCWQDYQILDLYAGTGALGMEALSRGATSALFVENSQIAYRCLQRNIEKILCEEITIKIVKNEALNVLKQYSPKKPFQALIFVDPPYMNQEYARILHEIEVNLCLKEHTWVVVEMPKKMELPQTHLLQRLIKSYGDTKVVFLEKQLF